MINAKKTGTFAELATSMRSMADEYDRYHKLTPRLNRK
jgi:hypothetical protein